MSRAAYQALVTVGLPVFNEAGNADGTIVKQPGDPVSKAELAAARQTDTDVDNLIKGGALEEVHDA